MANEEQLAILKQGVDVWNSWRKKNPEAKIDLSAADLTGSRLMWANLSGADLSAARLTGARLMWANLSGADLRWADLSAAHLREADLGAAHLRGADLSKADLYQADLSAAHLTGARLMWADLREADLGKADLGGANLGGANLRKADLRKADLGGAVLDGAVLDGADLGEANLHDAQLAGTVFGDIDLSTVKGLDSVRHDGPSTIGVDSIYKSKGNIPEVFLRGLGVPENFITYMRSLTGRAFEFYSCFISYSSKDQEFADRLYADLQKNAVRCWFAPHDMKIGDTIRDRIEQEIRVYDKLLLVLSQNSIESDWVESEVEAALEKEQKQKRSVLFPLRIDDVVMNTEKGWAAKFRRARHIGDMCTWKDHDRYMVGFDRLLRDLKAEVQ